jgi:stage IV sporulation protein B
LKSGDLIQGVGEKRITDKESLVDYVEKSNTAELPLTVCRNGETMVINVSPVVSVESGKKKLGVWVRDSTKGIGTITCYDKNGNFYALGHPVTDVDTGELMQIRQGKIMPTTITEVQRGQKGSPGELVGSTENEIKLGSVFANTYRGIQGRFSKLPSTSTSKSGMCKIALKSEVQKGKATILATTDSSGVKEYEIEIESLTTLSSDSSKAMIIRITDERLLNKTGGIVRGMSGAPILQNGRLVGAVTHVFVQDPTRGYGIYIEDML